MPVSGNKEPGVLARQASDSFSGIPFKKRWNSMVQPRSPIRTERSFSNENESKTKDSGLGEESTLNSCKSVIPKNSLLEVKQERSSGVKVESQPTVLPFLSISPETNPNTSSGPSRNVDDLVKPTLTEKLVGQEAIGTTKDSVKREVIAKQGERPANLRHVEVSLGPHEPHVSSLVDPNIEGSFVLRGTVKPSLLSPSLNKGEDVSPVGSCKIGLNNNDADDTSGTDRSNWDLNAPMDSWEGSGDVVPVQDASQVDLLRKTSNSLDSNPPISPAPVIGSNRDKGTQDVGASDQEFSFPISSLPPTLRYKSVDVLRLLGSTFPEFDSSILQSKAKVDSSMVSPNPNLPKNLALNRNMNSPTRKSVKSEPVKGTLVQANAGTAVRPAGQLEANVVKTEVERQNLQSIELSTKGPRKLLEQEPMKCEPLQEISMTSDVIVNQSVGKVLQHRESSSPCSSSSSTLPMPLTPQQGCRSRLATRSDLSASVGDLSTPSEYSVQTNEANRSKDALDQAIADIAAKNANFDLKESNVSSDKVVVSVSAGMNIEDQMVYKKTQDQDNSVASGDEKVSISADTEEECYGSDCESDDRHAFAGHVDSESVGCVREDEEYEDGEVREPMMQSIAEDPIAEGIDSEKNDESSSKNAQSSSGFSGVGESRCFTNDERGSSIPVHTESNDDFGKGCEDKADKIDHKDGNLPSRLLDKEETTVDDEQRPIGAIHQGPVDQSGKIDAQEGCEKDVVCDGASAGSSEAGRNVGETKKANIGRSDMSSTAVSSLQNTETSATNANSSKDASNFGSKSRIISLSRASNVTYSSNFRPSMDRPLSSRSGRERYSDMDEEKIHPRRNRDEIYADGYNYVRDRIQDRSFGSSRGNFIRGRGRGSGRFDSSRRDWDSGRDFESYGVADYHFRRKRTAAVEESENELDEYDSRLDGAAFASNRRRKSLNDALPSFRHPPARRLSPNEREDAGILGIPILRRAPRNVSPSRGTDEDDSVYVGRRNSEKFNRDFPADISDPVYSRQQSMYDGPDGHFVQGNTTSTAMQRRGFPRRLSKSPVRSRTRSLGSWSSPRRRMTEGFDGHQDSSQRRSPVMHREDRMRSTPRTSFSEEMIAPRRRDSPSYTARRLNDMRDVDAVQEHRHPRSLSSRRSPPDRVYTRRNRRVENRERADDDDEYFDGPIRSGRFPELHSGGNSDERRKYGERQGGPRRMRSVEEQEGNFKQSEQLWREEEYEDSKSKKRRF